MATEELRVKLVVKFAMKLGLDVDDAHDFANALIAIVCEQRQALESIENEEVKDRSETHCAILAYEFMARAERALRDTDEKLKAMGVL